MTVYVNYDYLSEEVILLCPVFPYKKSNKWFETGPLSSIKKHPIGCFFLLHMDSTRLEPRNSVFSALKSLLSKTLYLSRRLQRKLELFAKDYFATAYTSTTQFMTHTCTRLFPARLWNYQHCLPRPLPLCAWRSPPAWPVPGGFGSSPAH